MKFVLEFNVSDPAFADKAPGLIDGHVISMCLGEVASRIDRQFMEVGEKGVIMDINGDSKIGSWGITD